MEKTSYWKRAEEYRINKTRSGVSNLVCHWAAFALASAGGGPKLKSGLKLTNIVMYLKC
jgi:hypothetical protein